MEMVPPQIVAAGAAGPSPPRNMWCVLAEGSNAVGRRERRREWRRVEDAHTQMQSRVKFQNSRGVRCVYT